MKFTIYTDGASRGNPGHSSYGFVILDEWGRVIYKKGKYIGHTTNNVAEYTAVLEALKYVKQLVSSVKSQVSGKKQYQVELYADSKLVAEQLSGNYKIKAKHLMPYFEQIRILTMELGGIVFGYIPREANRVADALANRALDEKSR